MYFVNFCFWFGTFKSWLQNFGLIQTDLKFWNFWLVDGESLKNQYLSYLELTVESLKGWTWVVFDIAFKYWTRVEVSPPMTKHSRFLPLGIHYNRLKSFVVQAPWQVFKIVRGKSCEDFTSVTACVA
jgi:hypothetical protein